MNVDNSLLYWCNTGGPNICGEPEWDVWLCVWICICVCLWASATKCNTLSEIHTLLIVCTALCLHCLGLSHSGSPHNVLHSNSYLHLSNTQGIYIFIHSIGNVFVYCYTCSSIRTVFVYLTLVLCPIMEDNTIMHSMVSSWPLVWVVDISK